MKGLKPVKLGSEYKIKINNKIISPNLILGSVNKGGEINIEQTSESRKIEY